MAGASKRPEPEQRLSNTQRLAWLRLLRSENVGPATFRALVNQFGGAQAAIDALPDLSRRGGRTHAIRLCSIDDAAAELVRARRIGAHLVAHGERGYPPALAHADGSPPLIYVKGRLELAEMPIVSIVGARNGSAAGQKFTRQIANALGLDGFVIASGLARGIDTAARTASLGNGTIAVVAGGIDIVYPPENADLQAAIGERGLLISERTPGYTPRAKDFLPSPLKSCLPERRLKPIGQLRHGVLPREQLQILEQARYIIGHVPARHRPPERPRASFERDLALPFRFDSPLLVTATTSAVFREFGDRGRPRT